MVRGSKEDTKSALVRRIVAICREAMDTEVADSRGFNLGSDTRVYIGENGESVFRYHSEGTLGVAHVLEVGLIGWVNIHDSILGFAEEGDGLSADLLDAGAGEEDSGGNAW